MLRNFAACIAVAAGLGLLAISCEAQNTNEATCDAVDCAASCEALGYLSGVCLDGICACELSDAGFNTWDGGSDTDSSAARTGD